MTEKGGAVAKVADALRAEIRSGKLRPGAQLSQERVREAHGVSRSTLREAFQLLIRERLLVHELSRGVFVRKLTRKEVADQYLTRRIIECGALRSVDVLTPESLRRISATISAGRTAADEERWTAAGAAVHRFHEVLVSLAGSEWLDGAMSALMLEVRLTYTEDDATEARDWFLKRNEEIAEVLRSGDIEGAAHMVDRYLIDSEALVLRRYPE